MMDGLVPVSTGNAISVDYERNHGTQTQILLGLEI